MSRLDFRRSQHLSSLSPVSRWQRDHEGSGASSVDRRDQSQRRCPLWFKTGHDALQSRCPLYPQKRTWLGTIVVSALCHKRTSGPLLDHIVPYWITSSASATKFGGTPSPRFFAVLPLMTNSNLAGCSTGRSAGLAPRRILSTKSAARANESVRFAP